MPGLYQDRVKETTTTTGTGTVTLAGAVAGYVTFQSVYATGSLVSYAISDGGSWEVGLGILVTTTTLSRVTVLASSAAGALVNFGSGTKTVWANDPAELHVDAGYLAASRGLWFRR